MYIAAKNLKRRRACRKLIQWEIKWFKTGHSMITAEQRNLSPTRSVDLTSSLGQNAIAFKILQRLTRNFCENLFSQLSSSHPRGKPMSNIVRGNKTVTYDTEYEELTRQIERCHELPLGLRKSVFPCHHRGHSYL